MADIPIVFPFKDIDWTNSDEPVVTELNLPFHLAYNIVGGKCALVEVLKFKPGFKLKKFLNEKCDLKILKGSYIRKLTKDKSCTNHRNTWKKSLQPITGLGFTASNKATFDSDTSTIEINSDVVLKDIKITSLCALLWGVSTSAPDKISLVIDNKYSRSIRMYSLVGKKGESTPSKSEIEQTEKDFFSQNQTPIPSNSLATSLTPQNTANNSENNNKLYADILNRRKNIILEGPPGTGKTHAIKGIVEQLEKRKEDGGEGLEIGGRGKADWAITMHPATSYEDFIEGLRPAEKSDEDAKSSFIYKPGVFVERVRDAIQNPHQQHVVLLDELNRSNVPRVLGDLLTTLEASKRTKRYNYSESGNKNLTPIKSCDAEIIYLQYTDKDKDSLSEKRDELLQKIDNAGDAEFTPEQLKAQINIIKKTNKRALKPLIKELKEKVGALQTTESKGNRNIIKKLCEIRNIPISNTAVDSFRPGIRMYEGSDTFNYIGKEGNDVTILAREKRRGKEDQRDIGHGKIIDSCLVSKDGEKYCAFLKFNDLAHPILAKDVEKLIKAREQNWHKFEIDNLSILDEKSRQLEVAVMGTSSISPGTDGDRYSQFIDVKIADYYNSECNGTCQFENSERYWCELCDRNWNKEKRTEVTLSGSKKKLHIPNNLLVVGTMNTTDRSVAPLDSALRRRFVFLRVDPQTGIFKKEETKFQALSKDAKQYFNEAEQSWNSLNTWLETNLGKDATIGHSYLFELIEQLSEANDSIGEPKKFTKQMWQYSILPQLADLLDATGQAHALWNKNDKRAEKVIDYLNGLELELETPDEDINRTFSRTLVHKPKKKRNKTEDEEE